MHDLALNKKSSRRHEALFKAFCLLSVIRDSIPTLGASAYERARKLPDCFGV